MIAVEWLEGVTNARQTLKANDFQRRVMNFNEIHNYAAARAFHFAKRINDKGGGEAINHSNPLSFFHHILSSCSKTLPTFHFFESVYIYIYSSRTEESFHVTFTRLVRVSHLRDEIYGI